MPDEAHTSRHTHRYLAAFAHWFWLVALCTAVGAAGTFAMTAIQTPIYRATTILFVGQQSANVPLVDSQLVTTYAQLVSQPGVLAAAARQIGGISPADLAKQVRVAVESNTSLIDVSVDNPDPNRAARLSNAVAGAFISEIGGQTVAAAYPVVILQPAGPPSAPDHPKPLLNTLVGGAFGLALAIILVHLLDLLGNRTRITQLPETKTHLTNHQEDNSQNLTDMAIGKKHDPGSDYQKC